MSPKTDELVRISATFFYLGKSPKAPGTVGTLGAIPLVWFLQGFGPIVQMGFALLLTFFAIFVCTLFEARFGVHDPGEIVIDEVVGYVIAMMWLPATWQAFLAAFILFRVFDIWKPFPIGHLDKNIKGGLGVVTDDVAAGLVTNFILQVVFTYTGLLGVQLG